ncbi:hypothetical protein CFAEC_09610 [Corynebacterium faecale]|uniref:PRC-barrel domain containing protein n=1 Tax=Corynebacterium faecale TaxID=1758466 RepID=UPI0025B5678D|nr:PRC-barrel domain containing protein [Corynebacterium faecale]WJY92739.1 hypothetical protein CFAEC_09610 [Corynebacterium faecale]
MSEHTTKYEIVALLDAIAHDKDGHKLGAVNGIFTDDSTGLPVLVEVNHGLFGRHTGIVPLRGSRLKGHTLTLGFSKDAIKDAPDIDPNFGLSSEERETILAHYGLSKEAAADYFHPVMPELPDGDEVGLKAPVADSAGPGDSGDPYADKVNRAEAPHDATTAARDAADDRAEAERIRLSKFRR